MSHGHDDEGHGHGHGKVGKLAFALKCLNALGVVYGDIGTSPLYVFKSIFPDPENPPDEDDVRGALCLILWSLTLVVTVKYLIFILQADFKGEGGMFALLSLMLYDPRKDDDILSNPHLHDLPHNLSEADLVSKDSHGVNTSETSHNTPHGESVPLEDNTTEIQQTGDDHQPTVSLDDEADVQKIQSEIHVKVNEDKAHPHHAQKKIHLKDIIENPLQVPGQVVDVLTQEINKMLERFESLKKLHPSPFLQRKGVQSLFSIMAIIGASLLLGDGITTPSISVISAVEGLTIVSEDMEKWVVPITCAILIVLFWAQRYGTAKVGAIFGPIMLLWFTALALLGIKEFVHVPEVFEAIHPAEGYRFFARKKYEGWALLGSVVLCITGGEAMFADMGHFGKWPVRTAWLGLVYPAILCQYFGQGAMLIRDPTKINDPFFNMVPKSLFWPIFALAAMATVIASQALISGAFSIVQQAISMKIFPKIKIIHTSEDVEGQIYIPVLNYMLGIMCLILVVAFGSSSKLGALYGLAVCGDMTFTTIFFAVLSRCRWKWHFIPWSLLILQMLIVDLGFLSAATLKIPSGAWFTIAFGSILFTGMFVWRWGKRAVQHKLHANQISIEQFLEENKNKELKRSERIGVYLTSVPHGVPAHLSELVQHTGFLQKCVVFMTVKHAHIPKVPEKKRVQFFNLKEKGFYRVIINLGYRETGFNVQQFIHGLVGDIPELQEYFVSYFVGIENVIIKPKEFFLKKWGFSIFNILLSLSYNSSSEFNLPSDRTVAIGQDIIL